MWLLKRLTRHRKKNLLLVLVVFFISVLFFISTAIRENSTTQMKDFLSSYKVIAYYLKKESFFGNQPGGFWLAPKTAEIPLQYEEYFSAYNLTRHLNLLTTNLSGDKQIQAFVLGLTDLTMVERPEYLEVDLNGYTPADFKVNAPEPIALVSKGLADHLTIGPGDEFYFIDERGKNTAFTVCGIFESEGIEAVVPVTQTKNIHVSSPNILSESGAGRLSIAYDTNEYVLKDINLLREFKLAMAQELEPRGVRFIIDDSALTETLRPLQTTTLYMDSAILILLVISVLIAFMISFILLKSRTVDIAILYCIGMHKVKIFFSLFTELVCTTLIAMLAGAFTGFFISHSLIDAGATNIWESLYRLLLLLMAFSVGAAVSIISSITIKPMDILTKKEG